MEKISIDGVDIQDIYEFMETGNVENAPPEIVRYLELLDATHGMHLRIKQYGTRQAIIKHLEIVEGISAYKANQLYDETLEYFYRDVNISKGAWRNIYADKIDRLATAATLMAKTPEDMDRVSRMITRAAKMRQLDLVEPPPLPQELFDKPFKVYMMNPEFLGEGKIDRQKLAHHIDSLPEHSEAEKTILKEEAAILPIKLFKDEPEDSRKSER